jgi:hypothetical protein
MPYMVEGDHEGVSEDLTIPALVYQTPADTTDKKRNNQIYQDIIRNYLCGTDTEVQKILMMRLTQKSDYAQGTDSGRFYIEAYLQWCFQGEDNEKYTRILSKVKDFHLAFTYLDDDGRVSGFVLLFDPDHPDSWILAISGNYTGEFQDRSVTVIANNLFKGSTIDIDAELQKQAAKFLTYTAFKRNGTRLSCSDVDGCLATHLKSFRIYGLLRGLILPNGGVNFVKLEQAKDMLSIPWFDDAKKFKCLDKVRVKSDMPLGPGVIAQSDEDINKIHRAYVHKKLAEIALEEVFKPLFECLDVFQEEVENYVALLTERNSLQDQLDSAAILAAFSGLILEDGTLDFLQVYALQEIFFLRDMPCEAEGAGAGGDEAAAAMSPEAKINAKREEVIQAFSNMMQRELCVPPKSLISHFADSVEEYIRELRARSSQMPGREFSKSAAIKAEQIERALTHSLSAVPTIVEENESKALQQFLYTAPPFTGKIEYSLAMVLSDDQRVGLFQGRSLQTFITHATDEWRVENRELISGASGYGM